MDKYKYMKKFKLSNFWHNLDYDLFDLTYLFQYPLRIVFLIIIVPFVLEQSNYDHLPYYFEVRLPYSW